MAKRWRGEPSRWPMQKSTNNIGILRFRSASFASWAYLSNNVIIIWCPWISRTFQSMINSGPPEAFRPHRVFFCTDVIATKAITSRSGSFGPLETFNVCTCCTDEMWKLSATTRTLNNAILKTSIVVNPMNFSMDSAFDEFFRVGIWIDIACFITHWWFIFNLLSCVLINAPVILIWMTLFESSRTVNNRTIWLPSRCAHASTPTMIPRSANSSLC